MTEQHDKAVSVTVPLRKWIQDEAIRNALDLQTRGSDQIILSKKNTLLRKTTVAYGIVELLKHSRILSSCKCLSMATICPIEECNIDNFVVNTSSHNRMVGSLEQAQWNNIRGVSMISPALSAQIYEPLFLSKVSDDSTQMGMYLEVDIAPPLPNENTSNGIDQTSNGNDCHLFGILFYELCTGMRPFPAKSDGNTLQSDSEPQKKRSIVRYDKKKGKSYSTLQTRPYTPLQELGFPSSISMLVQNLIDGHDSYSSLDPASSDIHLLISDPGCFLFDLMDSPVNGNSIQLHIKKGKLYGREKEVSLITDAFCRVSAGTSEAFFIGGYSGSGKTMLVQSLTARVGIAGGYVLTQKIDQMSKERPLLGVLSAFNNLCLLIRHKSSAPELHKVANNIMHDFETDFSVLARLLPNINVLFPCRTKTTSKDTSIEQVMTLQNVCHTLQRFMRIVSSGSTPVMLFLDDLQWAGSTTLELIQTLLSDKRGSSCFFFVGSYRDNEVHDGHPIFALMSGLDSCGVKSTKEHMCGLNQNDLNMMISESIRIFPRLCKPLSDIIFEKTEGSPYFALEFLRLLVDRRLLKYSLRERRWIWDESKIHSENITDNVLYLLLAKVTSLPENIQLALKTISCFGIKTDERVVDYLSSTSQYSDFRGWLGQAINEGCIQKIENDYKFVHDKVREAAYSLITDNDKSQFHCDLGMLLYSAAKGQDLSSTVFQVVDQINHGLPLIHPMMRINVAKLNFNAGRRAMDFSDYVSANSYLSNTLSLLPKDYWCSHYDFSLRLFFLRAKAAFACGNIKEAHSSLKQILEKGRCIEDTLDAYHLHVTILHTCDESESAYVKCCEVLSQLEEPIPDSIDKHRLVKLRRETEGLLARMSDEDLLEMKGTDNTTLQFTFKFYNLLGDISWHCKPEMLPFICCRVVHLTVHQGICQDAVFGFALYAAGICMQCNIKSDIREACRIGKAAMSLLKQKRFDSPEIITKVNFCYYGFVSIHTEPLHLCIDSLRKGFEVGLSSGDINTASYLSMVLVRNSLLGGQNLSILIKEADYMIEVMSRLRSKVSIPYLTAYRETISTLIDNGQSDSSQNRINVESNAVYAERYFEHIYANKALQSFWLGHTQRCHHYSKKVFKIPSLGRHNRLVILFYATLNAFRGVKNINGLGSQFMKAKDLYTDAILTMRVAAELCPLNFSTKVYLLEAEMYSFKGSNENAKSSYSAAINSSCSSGYLHEHALAYELAGSHYKRIGEDQTGLAFFQQSRQYYMQWGSQMKVDSITQLIESIVPLLS